MFASVAQPIVTLRTVSRALVTLSLVAAAATTLSAQTTLRSIGASTVADEAVVTIEASGALPAPTVGALDGPPRIFLDFAGVRPATNGLAQTRDPRVRRVRVAVFSASPLVTRVVIDLVAVLPHRVELATGRAMVFIGAGAPPSIRPTAATTEPAPAAARPPVSRPPEARTPPPDTSTPAGAAPVSARIPPVPQLPPPMPDADALRSAPRTPAASSTATSGPKLPYRPPTTPPPAKDLEKYRSQANPLLERFKLQMPTLELMESLEEDLGARMPAVMQEFDRLRSELDAIKPPDTVRPQHDLLLQAARLGSTAARLRLEAIQQGDAALRRNAASAAAGAMLMLDRALGEVGFIQDR
jgi:AMIN domain-containing protein